MKTEESSYGEDWFRIAAKDFERVKRCMVAGDLEDAAFHLQQSLEKYLKGFLLTKKWQLKRHHNLLDLLKEAIKYIPELANFRELCQEVTQYYTVERYPLFIDLEIDANDLEATISRSMEMISLILSHYRR